MPVFDLFSKRQKRSRGEYPDTYQYDNIDPEFRVQVVHIIKDTIGIRDPYENIREKAYQHIHETLCKEYGVFTLREYADSDFSAIFDYFLEEKNHEKCLDIIELSFQVIDTYVRRNQFYFDRAEDVKQKPDDAIEELNARFKESGIGYQFEGGELMRIDSQFMGIILFS